MLMTKVKIELDPNEFRNFSNYQHNHEYTSLDAAVKAAALRSLPKRRKWTKEDLDQ